ncbi:MAG: transposase [Armatimonadota bacterium]|nr:transposase [Armatimonadota bacterium]
MWDLRRDAEVPLLTYLNLQQPRQMDERLWRRVLKGLSCRGYEACAEKIPEAFGLQPSAVSRRFIRASARKLQELQGRRLKGYDIVVLALDGKTFAEDEMVIALGVTMAGKKVILGFVETATENKQVCAAFLQELVSCGLRYEEGLLVVIDGSKGLHQAVKEVFGEAAQIQRCQWRKWENVVSHLPKSQQAVYRVKLQQAYEKPTYEGAKTTLERLHRELRGTNESAARSRCPVTSKSFHRLRCLGPSLT